jgi:hypothetical protein
LGFGLGLIDRDIGTYTVTPSLPEKEFLGAARFAKGIAHLTETN